MARHGKGSGASCQLPHLLPLKDTYVMRRGPVECAG